MKPDQIRKILKMNDELQGEGLRIAVLEYSVAQEGVEYYTDIINTRNTSYGSKHGEKSGEAWHTFKHKAEIFSLPPYDESADWILENNIDIVTMSIADSNISLGKIIKLSKSCFIITSGGNTGVDGETMRDTHGKYWFQVGAVDENLKPKSYSSWGRDMIDGATFTNLELENNYYAGTSGAGQLYGILIAEYFEAHNNFFGVKPSINQTIDFIDKHSHNTQILDPDSDLKMGYGVLILPEKYHFKKIEIRFKKGSTTSYQAVLIDEDGAIKTDHLLVPADIVQGRTRIGLRDAANILGVPIFWNGSEEAYNSIEMFVQQGDH